MRSLRVVGGLDNVWHVRSHTCLQRTVERTRHALIVLDMLHRC